VLVGYGEHISGTHFLGSLVLPPPVGGEVQVRFDMDEAGVLTVCATDASGRSVVLCIDLNRKFISRRFTSTNTSVGGIRRGDRADSHRARRCEPQYFRRREYNMPAMRNSRRLWRISSLEGYIATRRPRTPPVSGHSGRYNTRSGCVDRTIKDAEALRDPKMICKCTMICHPTSLTSIL
jgi:hypothetical protein